MGRIEVEHVTKKYDDVVAVDDMNLDIRDGEFVCLVGPSGCGKTTTLETIAGLTLPTGGEIRITDREVTDLPPKDRGIAMVFQNIALFPHMDVYDNISYGLRLRKMDEEEIDERVNQAVEILQLDGMLDRMPSELSGGQRQRVAIGRAIVRDPEAFLMDEPLANLDAKLRVHMRTELQRIQRELGTTTVYVTHDQEEAMTMSDRIAVINDGKLQQIAPPLTCYNQPANQFVAGFIGSPSMNFFDGRVGGGSVETQTFSVGLDASQQTAISEGQNVSLGVRPEDVYPVENARQAGVASESMTATIDVLEPIGDEIFVYLLLDGGRGERTQELDGDSVAMGADDQLLMSVEPDSDVEEGQELEVMFDREKIHLFDATSGDAVIHGIERVEVAAGADTGPESVQSDD